MRGRSIGSYSGVVLRGIGMETEFPHLTRAPIREAVLDIKVEARPGFTADDIAAFVEKVRSEFPDPRPIRTIQAELDLGGEEAGVRSIQDPSGPGTHRRVYAQPSAKL